MDTFLVITPGSFTTVQDKGRFGYQHMGIPVSGVLDSFACRVANLLVGNPEGSAVLESTIVGPQIAVLKETDIALTGAEMDAKLNYKPIENWKTIRVKPGDMLTFQQAKSGCRGYLAVSGGVKVPEVMGSLSTYFGGKIGGYGGRQLKKGDIVKRGSGSLLDAPRHLPEKWIPRYPDKITLRTVVGPQDDHFDEGLATLSRSEFLVTPRADRMGYRLQGEPIKHKENVAQSIISEPTMPGGIQVPADGQPIILLVEQTVGGYTKIATVISTDLPKIAQAVPGDSIKFESITLEKAHTLYREHEKMVAEIAASLAD
ncbi:MAG: biotin-dependent carboxyltransferase family protein [Desulfobacterales bacterium]|nr:biotin-dependent carboxyltransferase family protein [Desulfobacterales bacterium]